MKINRQPLAELSDEVVQRDSDYWKKLIVPMIGDWLTETTSVQAVSDFAKRIFLRKDYANFNGDRRFVQNEYSCESYSKDRSAIGGIYAWRLGISTLGREIPVQFLSRNDEKRNQMIKAADFAYRQSWALWPYSLDVIYRYVAFLSSQTRFEDAIIVVDTALTLSRDPTAELQLQNLSSRLRQARDTNKIIPPQSPARPSRH